MSEANKSLESTLVAIPKYRGEIADLDSLPDPTNLQEGDGFGIKNQDFSIVWNGSEFIPYYQQQHRASTCVAMFVHKCTSKDSRYSFTTRAAFTLYNTMVHKNNYEFLPEKMFDIALQRQMAIQYGATCEKFTNSNHELCTRYDNFMLNSPSE